MHNMEKGENEGAAQASLERIFHKLKSQHSSFYGPYELPVKFS